MPQQTAPPGFVGFLAEQLIHHRELTAAKHVITVENHWVASGLGRLVAEVLIDRRSSTQLTRVGVGDTFTHGGTASYLEDFYGLSSTHIRRAVLGALGVDSGEHDGAAGGGVVGLTEGVAEGL